jgi:hypothetical protein
VEIDHLENKSKHGRINCLRFELPMAVKMSFIVTFQAVTTYNLVGSYQRSRQMYHLHLQCSTLYKTTWRHNREDHDQHGRVILNHTNELMLASVMLLTNI